MLTELLYSLQDGNTPLHIATMKGHTVLVMNLLSNAGIDVNVKNTFVSGRLNVNVYNIHCTCIGASKCIMYVDKDIHIHAFRNGMRA